MITKITEQYMITATSGNQTARIHITVNNDDEVTIVNDKQQPQFVFTRSNKDMVAAIAECFKEAAELVDQRKEKAA